jgi:hypothetical protein
LDVTQALRFAGKPGNRDHQIYEQISRMLKRF